MNHYEVGGGKFELVVMSKIAAPKFLIDNDLLDATVAAVHDKVAFEPARARIANHRYELLDDAARYLFLASERLGFSYLPVAVA